MNHDILCTKDGFGDIPWIDREIIDVYYDKAKRNKTKEVEKTVSTKTTANSEVVSLEISKGRALHFKNGIPDCYIEYLSENTIMQGYKLVDIRYWSKFKNDSLDNVDYEIREVLRKGTVISKDVDLYENYLAVQYDTLAKFGEMKDMSLSEGFEVFQQILDNQDSITSMPVDYRAELFADPPHKNRLLQFVQNIRDNLLGKSHPNLIVYNSIVGFRNEYYL